MSQLAKTKSKPVAEQTPESYPEKKYRFPLVDISERENEYVIEADMPGACEENIDVQFHHGELTIQGKLKCSSKKSECAGEKNWRFRQFEPLDFYRVFRIGESVNAAEISAHYENGILTVHLPKTETAKPCKIEIKKK